MKPFVHMLLGGGRAGARGLLQGLRHRLSEQVQKVTLGGQAAAQKSGSEARKYITLQVKRPPWEQADSPPRDLRAGAQTRRGGPGGCELSPRSVGGGGGGCGGLSVSWAVGRFTCDFLAGTLCL